MTLNLEVWKTVATSFQYSYLQYTWAKGHIPVLNTKLLASLPPAVMEDNIYCKYCKYYSVFVSVCVNQLWSREKVAVWKKMKRNNHIIDTVCQHSEKNLFFLKTPLELKKKISHIVTDTFSHLINYFQHFSYLFKWKNIRSKVSEGCWQSIMKEFLP